MNQQDGKPPVTVDLYEELSRLNNEMADLQRELVKKNLALEKAIDEKNQLLREDPLTRVANSRYFQERFNDLASLSRRHNRPLTMIMFDLDNFKSINDTYGHSAGDAALKAFASLLQRACREEDVPARLGGDEFALILPETDGDAAFATAERLRTTFSETDVLENGTTITVSIGIARLAARDTCDTLMKKADNALYVSKKKGRNTTSIER